MRRCSSRSTMRWLRLRQPRTNSTVPARTKLGLASPARTPNLVTESCSSGRPVLRSKMEAWNRSLDVAAKSDFGRKVADAYREIKKHFEGKPVASNSPGTTPETGSVDGSVREQVISDIDHLIALPLVKLHRRPLDIDSSSIR